MSLVLKSGGGTLRCALFLRKNGPEVNVLKPNLRIAIHTLLDAGKAQREIERVLGMDRKTIRRIERETKSLGVATGNCAEKAAESDETSEQNPPPRPPAPHRSMR